MVRVKPEVIGDFGEFIAHQHLTSTGYQIVQFGKAMRRNKLLSLPIVPDDGIGYSYGIFGVHVYTFNLGEWTDSDIPTWADASLEKIKQFANICRNESECGIRERNRENAPCSSVDRILSKEWLCSITPDCTGPIVTEDGKRIIPKGNVVVGECLRRFKLLNHEHYKKNFLNEKNFILTNQLISEYIQKRWGIWNSNNPLPHSGEKIIMLQQNGNKKQAEILKEENRIALSAFPEGHPGRYDWIGKINNELTAIEVKTNSSTLNYWQGIRMGLLKNLGYNTLIVRVIVPLESFETGLRHDQIKPKSITVDSDIDFSSFKNDIPSIEEFIKVLEWAPNHIDGDSFPLFT